MPRIFMLKKSKTSGGDENDAKEGKDEDERDYLEDKDTFSSNKMCDGVHQNGSEIISDQSKVQIECIQKRRRRFKYIKSVEEFIEQGLIKAIVSNTIPDSTKTNSSKQLLWECGVCGKQFKEQYTLVRHLPIHTNERPFTCEDCGKAFRQASTLCRHRVIHSGLRPFKCSECSKSFNRSSTLIAHQRTHTDEKRHKCPHCHKAFHQKGNLKNHIFTHTGERPYKCDLCNQGFNQMSNLICHKSHAHVEKSRLTCTLCGKIFQTKYDLHCHNKYKHEIKQSLRKYSSRLVKKYPSKFISVLEKSESSLASHSDKRMEDILKADHLNNNIKIHLYLTVQKEPKDNCFFTLCQSLSAANIHDSLNTSLGTERVNTESLSKNSFESPEESVQAVDGLNKINEENTVSPPYCILIQPLFCNNVISTFEKTVAAMLLKPSKGLPMFVKIMKDISGKQLLVPLYWTPQNFNLSPKSSSQTQDRNAKSAEFVVPVIGTVIQKNNGDGSVSVQVEAIDRNILASDVIEQGLSVAYDANNSSLNLLPSEETLEEDNANDLHEQLNLSQENEKCSDSTEIETMLISSSSCHEPNVPEDKVLNSPIYEHSHYHKQINPSSVYSVNKSNDALDTFEQNENSSCANLRFDGKAIEQSLENISSEICALASRNVIEDQSALSSSLEMPLNTDWIPQNSSSELSENLSNISNFVIEGGSF